MNDPRPLPSKASRLRRSLLLLIPLAVLAGCVPTGEPVSDAARTAPWFSFSFKEFLHETRVNPEAMSLCAKAGCPARLAVAVLSAEGEDAARLDRILRKPALLVSELHHRERSRALRIRTKTGTRAAVDMFTGPLTHGEAHGFILVMSGKDAKGRIAGAVLGWRSGPTLHIAMAFSDDEDAAATAARQAVDHFRQLAPSGRTTP